MGFVPEPRRYWLVFTDPALGGLKVLAKSLPLGEFMEMTGLDETASLGGATLRDDVPVPATMLAKFAGCLVEWNLGPEGKPLPCTVATLRKQEVWAVRAMVRAWLEAVSGAPPPLPQASSNGQLSEEASLGLETLSGSLPS